MATSDRVDLYAAIIGMDGEILNLGKDRRFPTLLQQLTVTIRDERCQIAGCVSPLVGTPAAHVKPTDAPFTIAIRLESRQLTVAQAGRLIRVMRAVVGKAVTNGSVRASNANVTWLAENIALGSPVEIV